MTTFQMIAMGLLGAVALVQFLPKIPKSKTSTMSQIEQVIAIRDTSTNPEVVSACKALLQALLL